MEARRAKRGPLLFQAATLKYFADQRVLDTESENVVHIPALPNTFQGADDYFYRCVRCLLYSHI
jgi:hypothetical protein